MDAERVGQIVGKADDQQAGNDRGARRGGGVEADDQRHARDDGRGAAETEFAQVELHRVGLEYGLVHKSRFLVTRGDVYALISRAAVTILNDPTTIRFGGLMARDCSSGRSPPPWAYRGGPICWCRMSSAMWRWIMHRCSAIWVAAACTHAAWRCRIAAS